MISSQPFQEELHQLRSAPWPLRFAAGGDWRDSWHLDGLEARVSSTPDAFELRTGPEAPAGHAVLWTKQSFNGDLRIEYDFTRLDQETHGVNILYIQAQGTGLGPYHKDIFQWSALRQVPKMSLYHDHMTLTHLSYAAYEKGSTGSADDYIRARRYPVLAGENFHRDTEIPPSAFQTGLFETSRTVHVTAIKTQSRLFLSFESLDVARLFAWDTMHWTLPNEGPVGLRQMAGRASRYANFKVFAADG